LRLGSRSKKRRKSRFTGIQMTDIKTQFSRRGLLATSGGALLAGAAGPALAAASNVSGMPQEGPDTPKLTMYVGSDPTESELKKVKQIGINIVDMPDMPPPKPDRPHRPAARHPTWPTSRAAKIES
jgi:hypothetical protein